MSATLDDESRRVLAKAKEIIIACGWCQGQYTDAEGRYCILGAVLRAQDGDRTESVSILAGLTGGNEVAWNDTPGRTQAEVIQLLDKALGT